ncbi:MAG: glycosyltransferase [Candidatus Buchananbacteria bacterium]|nr:glycosyltransferase [Candidatus Buchananbacteria bacterium]
MKILQINKFFYKRGGAEAYMLALSNMLRQQGHQVVEFSMQHPDNLESPYSDYFVKHIDFQKRQGFFSDLKKSAHLLYSWQARNNLEKLIKKEKPDIAHLHNFYFQLTPSILKVLKKYNIPMVWTMHDYKLICPNYRLFTQGRVCERCKAHKYYNCFTYKCMQNNSSYSFLVMLETYLHNLILKSYDQIDLYISPSQFLQSKVAQWGINKVTQLYNFINLKDFEPDYNPGQYLLYFGRLAEEKGLLLLLQALREMPAVNLKIVGDGPQKQLLAKYIKEYNVNNVQLIGHTTGEKLYNLIKQARFVILPSIWYENNPISVLEAFALGKPVIGSDLGGIPELVKDGQTGVIFKANDLNDLKDKINKNYNNLEQISQMGRQARLFVETNCAPQKHYEQIELIYKKLLK